MNLARSTYYYQIKNRKKSLEKEGFNMLVKIMSVF